MPQWRPPRQGEGADWPHKSPSPEQQSDNEASHHSSHHHRRRRKEIPIESALRHLSASGIDSDDIGTHLVACFGDEASLKFRQGDVDHNAGREIHPDCGTLLSGCQANELSLDCPSEDGVAYGAYTNAVQRVLREHTGPISNRELVAKARAILTGENMGQHPCLYCSDENAGAPFLAQPEGY